MLDSVETTGHLGLLISLFPIPQRFHPSLSCHPSLALGFFSQGVTTADPWNRYWRRDLSGHRCPIDAEHSCTGCVCGRQMRNFILIQLPFRFHFGLLTELSGQSHFIANWSVVGEPLCAANRVSMTIANCRQRA